MKSILSLFLLLIFSATFVACDSKDGDWKSMKWETNIPITNKKHIVEASKSGDTYIFKCKNYASFWIDVLYENGKEIPINPENDGNVKGEWFSVSIEKNIMTVIVLPNHNNSSRYLFVGLTAGDIFDSFSFKQD